MSCTFWCKMDTLRVSSLQIYGGYGMDQVQIGKFISELRKEKGLTQEQLGERLGVTQKTVSRWENGRNMPDIAMLPILCEELDINIAELMNGARSQEEELTKADVAQAFEIFITFLKQADRELRRRWIKTAVAIALTIACMVGLYNYEFGVSVAATEDLEQAVNTFHFHEEMSMDVLERVTIGRHLYVLYSQLGSSGASGLAHLERGIFGKYRILNTWDTNDPLAGVTIVTAGGDQTDSVGKKRYALFYSANELPQVSRLELYGGDDRDRLPTDSAEAVDEAYPECLFSYEYDGRPLLKVIGLDDDTVVDIFGRSIRYYGENGDRYTIRQLAESFDTSGSESSSSTGVAETNMIYVLELIVLAIGVIFIRYFMK